MQARVGAGLLVMGLAVALAGCEKPMVPEDVTYKTTGDLYIDRVKPILEARCYRCHAGLNREGELRVDNRTFMLKGGMHGAAIVPGDASKSLMLNLMKHQGLNEKDGLRPMPNRKGMVPPQEIADIERWINAGAQE